MTKTDYDLKIKEIDEEARLKKKELAREFAFSNNSITPGDTIKDHVGTIKVNKVNFTFVPLDKYPQCIYTGINYNKNGSISKRMPVRHVYQCNLIK